MKAKQFLSFEQNNILTDLIHNINIRPTFQKKKKKVLKILR